MKVFGIGLQKTGTTTLACCFKELGLRHKTYDRNSCTDLRNGRQDRLISVMERYDSFDDEPWAHCYKLADQMYPESKFILTIRKDSETWFESIRDHCDRIPFNEHRKYFFGYLKPRNHKEAFIAAYEAHNRAVMRHFSDRPEKLLVISWSSSNAWRSICQFLDVPFHNLEIPTANARPTKAYPPLNNWRIAKSIPGYYLRHWVNDFLVGFRDEKNPLR